MQPTNKVLQGQTFVDMVCQQSGSYEEIISAAILNGKSITGDIAIGEEINVANQINVENISILTKKRPASGIIVQDSDDIDPEGISIWAINKDFIVNG